ncbi:maleate cis-trans isomerase family protein [Salipiger mucosus]|uniref:Putative decarboxylase n=1 Tax=Salipiger mucosus DSM 16094 TaxID=1123237 RepID=S9QAJ3_9RHOB|nr:hypothetical protein [Salipiger mucosus]EPX76628.1 Putative decarboxylase [Salipiger mucosus DSM 16094]
MTEYAPDGLFGLLTPQANTTVEAEFRVFCPPGMLPLTARMTSGKPGMEARLVDYAERLGETVDRFANAPLGAVAVACTGMSYLVDPAREAEAASRICDARGYPVLTAAQALRTALETLGARRIGIVSPYGDALHEEGLRYWSKLGFEIGQAVRLAGDDSAFHAIYGLSGEASRKGLAAVDTDGLDAVAILGTGLPTLDTLLAARGGAVPVLTPNLALAWLTVCTLRQETPTPASLASWTDGSAWAARYVTRDRRP